MKHPIDFANDAEALIARMDLDVRASLLSGSSFWHLQDVAEHGLSKVMVSDGPHGLRKQSAHADHLGMQASVPATCFPTAVTLASSWDTDLIAEVGVAIGRECQAEDVAVLLGPGVNIKRSPLCGRNFEYYSEDPVSDRSHGRGLYCRCAVDRHGHQHQTLRREQSGSPAHGC